MVRVLGLSESYHVRSSLAMGSYSLNPRSRCKCWNDNDHLSSVTLNTLLHLCTYGLNPSLEIVFQIYLDT